MAAMATRALLLSLVFAFAPAGARADPCEAPLPKPGESFAGQVRYVGDGDSLCVGWSARPTDWVEVRISDFHAPELHAPGGAEAKAALRRLVMPEGAMPRPRPLL